MYSWEIENLLRAKNYLLSNEEYFGLFDTSPQIRGVEYKPYEDRFHIWTDDRYDFNFKVYKKEKNDGRIYNNNNNN